MHVIMPPSRMPLTQFTQNFLYGHLHPAYFRYQVPLQLFLFPMSDFCSCIDMSKRVFKSISNICQVFCFTSQQLGGLMGQQNLRGGIFFLFLLIKNRSGLKNRPGLGDLFFSHSCRDFYKFYFQGYNLSERGNYRWLIGWVLWYINLCGLFNSKSIFMQIISSISNNSVEHEYTVKLSKTFLFQDIQFIQRFLIQVFQFSINTDFVYTKLIVKTVLYQTIQFSVSRVSMSKTVPFQTIQFSISTQFKCKYTVYLSKTLLFQAIQFSQTIQFSISMPFVLFNP